jgi:hypothetical protein
VQLGLTLNRRPLADVLKAEGRIMKAEGEAKLALASGG